MYHIDEFQFDEPELADLIDLCDHGQSQNEIFVEHSTPADSNLVITKFDDFLLDYSGNSCFHYFKINDLVCVNKKKLGLVKYLGRVHFADGVFCGMELTDSEGKHDGIIDNIR
jgi:hypothetical protein